MEDVTGTPLLALNTTPTQRSATYASGSGSNTLTFTYAIQAGDTSADLDYASTSALTLNSGTIRDTAGNNSTLTLASPGAAGSLGANKTIVIDNTAPTAPSVALQAPATSPNTVTTPTILVSGVETSAAVSLHTDNACATSARATGTASGSSIDLTSSALTEAAYTFYAKQTDQAGNVSACSSVGVAYALDTSGPTVSLTSLTGGGVVYRGGSAQSITWTASDTNGLAANPISLHYSTNGGSTWTSITAGLSNSGSYNWTLPSVDSTSVRVRVTAQDAAGNQASSASTSNFTIDSTPPSAPTFTGTTPTSPSQNSNPLVRGSSSADSVTIRFYSDNSCSTEIGSGTKATFESTGVSITATANSTTTVYAKAFDSVGNGSTCVSMVSYLHDTIAPSAPTGLTFGPVPSDITQSPTMTWSSSSDGSGSGILRYEVRIVRTSDSAVIQDWTPISYGAYVSGLVLDRLTTYSASVRAIDNVGLAGVASTPSDWITPEGTRITKLTSNLAPLGDYFLRNGQIGYAVALSEDGSTLAVGAPFSSPDNGTVYIYVKSGGSWVFQQKLQAPENVSSVQFGQSLSLSGDTLVVGSLGDGSRGAAYVFVRSGSTWTLQQDITPNSSTIFDGDNYGISVAVSGDTVVVGAANHAYTDFSLNGNRPNAGAAFVWVRSGNAWTLQSKLAVTGATRSVDKFGTSVAIQGDHIVVGAPEHSYDASDGNFMYQAGAAFVYSRSGSVWSLQQKFAASRVVDRSNGWFGASVAISQGTIVIGAPQDSTDASELNEAFAAGAAYVYVFNGSTWSLQQKLSATGTNARSEADLFGYSVSISGDRIAIGSPSHDFDAAGANEVESAGATFHFLRSSGTWIQQEKIVATGPNARTSSEGQGPQFGWSVAIADSSLAVGMPYFEYDASGTRRLENNPGIAFTYTLSGGSWTPISKLPTQIETLPSRYTAADSKMGQAIAISADGLTMVVGSPGDKIDSAGDNYMPGAGSASVYVKSGNAWTLQQILVPTGATSRQGSEGFGSSVAISGDTIAVGASGRPAVVNGWGTSNVGAVFVFTRSGSAWTQQEMLVPTGTNARQGGDRFGHSVAIDGDTIIAGAPYHGYDEIGDEHSHHSGAAFVFTRSGSTWTQQAKLIASGPNARNWSDAFGSSVSISGHTVAISAPYHSFDGSGDNEVYMGGAAFIFTRSGSTWTQQQKIVPSGPNARREYGMFGDAISISGDLIVVGNTNHDYDENGVQNTSGGGAAFVFARSGGVWTQQQKLTPPVPIAQASGSQFGISVAARNDTIVIGAPNHRFDSNGNQIWSLGAVFVYTRSGATWTSTKKLISTPAIRELNGTFGVSVAVSGSGATVAIGAKDDQLDANGENPRTAAGAAYLFEFEE